MTISAVVLRSLSFCLIGAIVIGASAAEDEIRLVPEFDAAKIPPPDAAKPPPLARVFGRYLYPDEFELPAGGWDQTAGERLAAILMNDVVQVVRRDPRLQATPEEIAAFTKAMDAMASEELRSRKKPDDKEQETAERTIGEMMVGNWKLDRALYRKYGGTVIFQQANPYEPVGAYYAWIKELTESRIIEVYDAGAKEHVWHYFERKHPFVVKPKDVIMDSPWWMQKRMP